MYEIFVQLLDRTGKKSFRCSKSHWNTIIDFSDWKKGKSSPKAEKLQKIADYFGVSVDYLMTGKEEPDKKKNPYSDLKGIYLSYAKEAQDSGIDPDDIRIAIDTIKRLRGGK